MFLQSLHMRTPFSPASLLGVVVSGCSSQASWMMPVSGSATMAVEHFCSHRLRCSAARASSFLAPGSSSGSAQIGLLSCGEAHTTRPHRRQWCLRTVRLNDVSQIGQRLASRSSCHLTIVCSRVRLVESCPRRERQSSEPPRRMAARGSARSSSRSTVALDELAMMAWSRLGAKCIAISCSQTQEKGLSAYVPLRSQVCWGCSPWPAFSPCAALPFLPDLFAWLGGGQTHLFGRGMRPWVGSQAYTTSYGHPG